MRIKAHKRDNEIQTTRRCIKKMNNLHGSNVMILTSNNILSILTCIRYYYANSLVADRSDAT